MPQAHDGVKTGIWIIHPIITDEGPAVHRCIRLVVRDRSGCMSTHEYCVCFTIDRCIVSVCICTTRGSTAREKCPGVSGYFLQRVAEIRKQISVQTHRGDIDGEHGVYRVGTTTWESSFCCRPRKREAFQREDSPCHALLLCSFSGCMRVARWIHLYAAHRTRCTTQIR